MNAGSRRVQPSPGACPASPPALPQKVSWEGRESRPEARLPSLPQEVLPRVSQAGGVRAQHLLCFLSLWKKKPPNPEQTIKMFQLLAQSSDRR